jgi:hypothetical protein
MSAKTFGERFREEFRAWASEAFRDPHDWHVADEAFDYIAGVLILDCAGEDAKSCIVPISLIPDVGGPKMREIDEDATLARIASALLRARGEENEAAAKECERCGREWDDDANRPPLGQRSINSAFMASGALKCAAAIRARRNR